MGVIGCVCVCGGRSIAATRRRDRAFVMYVYYPLSFLGRDTSPTIYIYIYIYIYILLGRGYEPNDLQFHGRDVITTKWWKVRNIYYIILYYII